MNKDPWGAQRLELIDMIRRGKIIRDNNIVIGTLKDTGDLIVTTLDFIPMSRRVIEEELEDI